MKKKILLITALFSFSLVYGTEGKETQTRTASHSVSITSSTDIDIQTKYTYLEIETWDRDEVSIEANISFNGKMNSRVQEFLDDFEKNVKEGVRLMGNQLTIDAQLEEPNKVQIGGRNAGINISYGDKELSVSYVIKLPGSNDLKIKGAYKDMVLIGTFADVDITQYSADLTADNFVKANLNLKYGDAQIETLNDVEMELYEQDMEVGQVSTLDLNAKYSELTFNQIGEMTVVGYETDFDIEDMDLLNGELKYGNMNIAGTLGRGTLTLYEFDLNAGEVENFRLDNSKYSKIEIDKANEVRFVESYEDNLEIRYLGKLTSKSKYGNYTIEELGGSLELDGYEDDVTINHVSQEASQLTMDGKYLTLDINLTGVNYSLTSDLKYGDVNYDESKVDVRRYIKENSTLKVELSSKSGGENGFQMSLTGYEVKVDID